MADDTQTAAQDEETEDKRRPFQDPKILEEARTRWEQSEQLDKHNFDAMRSDLKFIFVPGAQWPDGIRTEREKWGDPCLEFNQTKQFTNQTVNDMRQKRPGIRIHPAGGEASKEVAKLLQGMVRGIEYESDGEAVYDGAYQHAVCAGRGFTRVLSEYADDDTFNQKLVLRAVVDCLSVRPDPTFTMPDASDMNWCFVTDTLPKDQFFERYPWADAASWAPGENALWYVEDKIVVADYYRRVFGDRVLVAMEDTTAGLAQPVVSVGWEDELPKKLPPKVREVKRRVVRAPKIEWYTIAGGNQILKKHHWPGTIIPVIMHMGDTIVIEGKRYFQSLIRHARDSQSLFNFGTTQQAIHLSLTPRAPYIMAEGQDEGYTDMWDNANRRNYGKLIYKPTQFDDGTPVPPPQRQAPSMVDAGWAQMGENLKGLLKSTMGGLYENTLGMVGNEVSGKAILAREQQGDTATFHFADNHSRAIALVGKVCVECIPYYYDNERMVTVINDEDQPEMQQVNSKEIKPDGTLEAIRDRNITIGKYAVTIEAGQTYKSKREEAAAFYTEIVKARPDIMTVAGDLIIASQDVDGADKLADRMKYLWPPELKQAEAAKAAGQNPEVAQLTAQMQQMQQALEQCTQMLQATQMELDQVKKDKTAQIESAQAKTEQTYASIDNDRDATLLKAIETMFKMALEGRKQETAEVTAQAQAVVDSNNSQDQLPGG